MYIDEHNLDPNLIATDQPSDSFGTESVYCNKYSFILTLYFGIPPSVVC